MSDVVMYSTGCPRCDVLKKKLEEKNIIFNVNNDTDLMLSLGINEVPVLVVDGNKMEFREAVKWINEQ